jgi:hypothetical protein
LPTETDADFFDVPLISGTTEADVPPAEEDVRVAANRLFDAAAPIRPNPFYAGASVHHSGPELGM